MGDEEFIENRFQEPSTPLIANHDGFNILVFDRRSFKAVLSGGRFFGLTLIARVSIVHRTGVRSRNFASDPTLPFFFGFAFLFHFALPFRERILILRDNIAP